MPVDFNRVPPRVTVPPAPQPSKPVWGGLLLVVMCAGAVLAIFLWPAGWPTNTSWFWFCVIGYPLLTWGFMLVSWLGYGYVCRNGAIATNRVSDEAEQARHAVASRPLTILGHAWCFSSNDAENALQGVSDGSVRAEPRPSRAVPNRDVNARWIEIPDQPVPAGNALEEHLRHDAVCKWLLHRLVSGIAEQLRALPARTSIQVELYVHSKLKLAVVQQHLQEALIGKTQRLRVRFVSGDEAVPLFRADAWMDSRNPEVAHLLVAIELRNAVSEELTDSVAEAGVALLVGHPRLAQGVVRSSLRLHRPAKGSQEAIATTLGLAARWGHTAIERVRAVWVHGVSSEHAGEIRHSAQLAEQTRWMALENSVGDCSGAGAWLAVALAAASAELTGEPQLVLNQEGDELVALVCEKQT